MLEHIGVCFQGAPGINLDPTRPECAEHDIPRSRLVLNRLGVQTDDVRRPERVDRQVFDACTENRRCVPEAHEGIWSWINPSRADLDLRHRAPQSLEDHRPGDTQRRVNATDAWW